MNHPLPQSASTSVRCNIVRGFTAVELLVVISITAVLLSMLMPSFQTAREQAKATTCTTNLKGIVLAEAVYVTDHNDYMTVGDTRAAAFGGAADLTWAGILVGTGSLTAPYITTENYTTHSSGTPLLLNSPLKCPSGLAGRLLKRFGPHAQRRGDVPTLHHRRHRPFQLPDRRRVGRKSFSDGGRLVRCQRLQRLLQLPDVAHRIRQRHHQFHHDPQVLEHLQTRQHDALLRRQHLRQQLGNNRISARHINGTKTAITFADGHATIAPSTLLPHVGMNDTQLRALSTDYLWTLSE